MSAATRGTLPIGALRKALVFAMNAIAFSSLAASGELDTATMVLFGCALAAGWFWEPPRIRFECWETPWTVLTLVLFGLTVLSMVRNTEFLLTTAMSFGVFLAGAKLFQLAQDKDFIQSMALSLLLLAAGSVVNDDMSFGVSFALYVVVSTTALTAHHLCVEVASQLGPGGRKTRVERPVLLATVSLAAFVLAGAVAFFFAFPRIGFGFFVQQNRGDQASGFSEDVELGQSGSIDVDESVVMRVRFVNYRPNPLEELYFRGVSLDRYTGRNWTDEDDEEASVERDPGGRGYVIGAPGVAWETVIEGTVVADVYLEPLDTPILFAPGRFKALGLPDDVTSFDQRLMGRALSADRTGEVRLQQRGSQGTMYRVYADPWRPNDDALDGARWPDGAGSVLDVIAATYRAELIQAGEPVVEPVDPRDPAVLERVRRIDRDSAHRVELVRRYLQVPASVVTPRMRELMVGLGLGARSHHDVTAALERRLRSFGYTTDIPAPSGPHANIVDEFLFDWRSGSCTYFATAFVLLLRDAGIPARIVNGYYGYEQNTVGDYYVVRQSNAHSWAEVYYPELGWVRFDPTPASPDRSTLGGLRRRVADAIDSARLQWFRWVVEYDLEKQYTAVRSAVSAFRGEDEPGEVDEDLALRVRDLMMWLWRRFAALALYVFLWICAVTFYRKRSRDRERWGLLDSVATILWAGAALAVSWRFWPGGLVAASVLISLVVPALTALIAWQLRRDLFDETRARRSGRLDEIATMYRRLLEVAERELGAVPLSLTPDDLVDFLDLTDPELAREVDALVRLYVEHRFAGAPPPPEALSRWRRALRPLLRRVARDLRGQVEADEARIG